MAPVLEVPPRFNRNHPGISKKHPPEETGQALINLICERIGLDDMHDKDVLDVGCGVRFAQAILNRNIPIKSYTGVDVYGPMIEFLQDKVADNRFTFGHWKIHNELYNSEAPPMTKDSSLPIEGDFDIIWLLSVFTHLNPTDADTLLGILRRYIRPDGYLFFSSFIENDLDGFEDKNPDKPLQQAFYGKEFMTSLILKNNWKIISFSGHDPSRFIASAFLCRPC
jgi:SAM-dependent methyltransferase